MLAQLTPALLLLLATTAHAQESQPATQPAGDSGEEEEEDEEYGAAHSWEVGGSLALTWTEDLTVFVASPSVGWFVIKDVELSARLDLTYTKPTDVDSFTTGALVLEPSYHFHIGDRLFFLTGLGFGVGSDGDDAIFEIVPRLGLNIQIGSSSVLTPAVRAPIILGGDGTDFSVIAEIGITSTL